MPTMRRKEADSLRADLHVFGAYAFKYSPIDTLELGRHLTLEPKLAIHAA